MVPPTMKNNTSTSGNVGIQVVAGILAVVAIILGIMALQSGNSSKDKVKNLELQLNTEADTIARVEAEVRSVKDMHRSAVMSLSQEIKTLQDQMTKKPEPTKPDVKKGDVKKGPVKKGDVKKGPAKKGTAKKATAPAAQ